MTTRTRITIALATVGALLVPAVAQAHVTVQPGEVPAGGFTRLDVRVPNEEQKAATTKVEVQMPDGFVFASYEPVPGWKVDVKSQKLDQPVETDDGSIDTQVKTITWTADSDAAGIQPGQFQDFGLSVGIPDQYKPGDELTFPAIQTYSDGEVVRWIEDPDGEHPASQVLVDDASDEGHHDMGSDEVASDAPDSESDDDDSDGAPTWLAVLGVVLGGLGVAIGGTALVKRK